MIIIIGKLINVHFISSIVSLRALLQDLVGPCTVTDKTRCDRVLNTMTFIDPATGWFEITGIPDKISARISQIFNST